VKSVIFLEVSHEAEIGGVFILGCPNGGETYQLLQLQIEFSWWKLKPWLLGRKNFKLSPDILVSFFFLLFFFSTEWVSYHACEFLSSSWTQFISYKWDPKSFLKLKYMYWLNIIWFEGWSRQHRWERVPRGAGLGISWLHFRGRWYALYPAKVVALCAVSNYKYVG
jgi:hypothetical protein